jgi:hypothetical protein
MVSTLKAPAARAAATASSALPSSVDLDSVAPEPAEGGVAGRTGMPTKRQRPHSLGEPCVVHVCTPLASVDGSTPVHGKLQPHAHHIHRPQHKQHTQRKYNTPSKHRTDTPSRHPEQTHVMHARPANHSLSGLNAAMETQWALWARAVSAMLAAATSCTGLFRGMEGTPDPGTVPGTSPSSTRVHAAKDLEIDSKLYGAWSADRGGGANEESNDAALHVGVPRAPSPLSNIQTAVRRVPVGRCGVQWCAVICSGVRWCAVRTIGVQ